MSLFLILMMAVGPARAQESGRARFDAAGCRSCHSIGNVGGNSGPDLTFVGFRRSREWLDLWLKEPKAWKPDTKMPNFRLNDADRGALVDYLASLKGQDFHGNPPWKDGESLYIRAGCVACHGPLGRGGMPQNNFHGNQIPAVYKVAEGYTLEELEKRIRSGRIPEPQDPSQPPPKVAMPAWGTVLKEDDIEKVARYLMSLAPPRPKDDF
jgi:mono/diheme cytochrome c family protein